MKYSRIICHLFILSTSRLACRTSSSSILWYIGPHRFVIIFIIRSVINWITWYSSTWMIVFWKNNSIMLKWLDFPTYKWSWCVFYCLSLWWKSHFILSVVTALWNPIGTGWSTLFFFRDLNTFFVFIIQKNTLVLYRMISQYLFLIILLKW